MDTITPANIVEDVDIRDRLIGVDQQALS